MQKERKGLVALELAIAISVSAFVGARIEHIGMSKKIQLQELENETIKTNYERLISKSYQKGFNDAYQLHTSDENNKYLIVEIDKKNPMYVYQNLDDLVVVTIPTPKKYLPDGSQTPVDSFTKKVLVDTKEHYFYKDTLDVKEEERFDEYLAKQYTKMKNISAKEIDNTGETRQIIRRLLMADENTIGIIDKETLKDLKIDKTSYDLFKFEYDSLNDNQELIPSIVNVENNIKCK